MLDGRGGKRSKRRGGRGEGAVPLAHQSCSISAAASSTGKAEEAESRFTTQTTAPACRRCGSASGWSASVRRTARPASCIACAPEDWMQATRGVIAGRTRAVPPSCRARRSNSEAA